MLFLFLFLCQHHSSNQDEGAEDGHPGDVFAEDEGTGNHCDDALGIEVVGGAHGSETFHHPVPEEVATC